MDTMIGRRRADIQGALTALLWCFVGSGASAQAAVPPGIWLIDGRAAVQIFDCAGMMCGRIVFLIIPRDANGQLNRDVNNPNPQLRQRQLCGLTIFWNLRPAGANRWARRLVLQSARRQDVSVVRAPHVRRRHPGAHLCRDAATWPDQALGPHPRGNVGGVVLRRVRDTGRVMPPPRGRSPETLSE